MNKHSELDADQHTDKESDHHSEWNRDLHIVSCWLSLAQF